MIFDIVGIFICWEGVVILFCVQVFRIRSNENFLEDFLMIRQYVKVLILNVKVFDYFYCCFIFLYFD